MRASNRRRSPGTSAMARWTWWRTRDILFSKSRWRWACWHQILRTMIALLTVILFPIDYAGKVTELPGHLLLASSLTSSAVTDLVRHPTTEYSRLRLRLLPRKERKILMRGCDHPLWNDSPSPFRRAAARSASKRRRREGVDRRPTPSRQESRKGAVGRRSPASQRQKQPKSVRKSHHHPSTSTR